MADTIDFEEWPDYLAGISRQFDDIDYQKALEDEVAPAYRERIDLNFGLEQTAGGEPWAPLSPVTVARKGHDKILVETQRMKAAATGRTGDSIQIATENTLTIGVNASAFPGSYPAKHESGMSRMPARPFENVNEEAIDRAAGRLADYAVRRMKK